MLSGVDWSKYNDILEFKEDVWHRFVYKSYFALTSLIQTKILISIKML